MKQFVEIGRRYSAAGQHRDAEGVFRAALSIDGDDVEALVLLSDCLVRRRAAAEIIETLIDVGRRVANGTDPAPAYRLFGRALELAPKRLELHVDIAELQASAGDVDGARRRLLRLAKAYRVRGKQTSANAVTDAAAALHAEPTGPHLAIPESVAPTEDSIPIDLSDLDAEPTARAGSASAPSRGWQPPKTRTMIAPVVRRLSGRRPPKCRTMVAPTLLRDAQGRILPEALTALRGEPAPSTAPQSRPAVSTAAGESSQPRRRPKTGARPTLPASKPVDLRAKVSKDLRSLRARAKVRHVETTAVLDERPLAKRLRQLSRPGR